MPIRNEIVSANKLIHKCSREECATIINARNPTLQISWYILLYSFHFSKCEQYTYFEQYIILVNLIGNILLILHIHTIRATKFSDLIEFEQGTNMI